MMAHDAQQDTARQEPIEITRGEQEPTLVLGPERLHYQFSVSLPLIHLTFVSIVQGVAFSVLLSNLPVPTSRDSMNVIAYFVAQHAYLAWLFSGLLIVIIWKQFVQAAIFSLWPLSTTQVGLMLLISVAEVTGFREITHFPAWVTCMGLVAITGGAIRLNNLRIQPEYQYASQEAKRSDHRRDLMDGILYLVLGILITVGGAYLHVASLPLRVAGVVEWAALGGLMFTMLAILMLDHRDTLTYITRLAAGSDLQTTPMGGVRYLSVAPARADTAPANGTAAPMLDAARIPDPG